MIGEYICILLKKKTDTLQRTSVRYVDENYYVFRRHWLNMKNKQPGKKKKTSFILEISFYLTKQNIVF